MQFFWGSEAIFFTLQAFSYKLLSSELKRKNRKVNANLSQNQRGIQLHIWSIRMCFSNRQILIDFVPRSSSLNMIDYLNILEFLEPWIMIVFPCCHGVALLQNFGGFGGALTKLLYCCFLQGVWPFIYAVHVYQEKKTKEKIDSERCAFLFFPQLQFFPLSWKNVCRLKILWYRMLTRFRKYQKKGSQ